MLNRMTCQATDNSWRGESIKIGISISALNNENRQEELFTGRSSVFTDNDLFVNE